MIETTSLLLGISVSAVTLYGLGYALGQRANGFVKKGECQNFRQEMRLNVNDVKLDTAELKRDLGEVKENVSYIRGKLDNESSR